MIGETFRIIDLREKRDAWYATAAFTFKFLWWKTVRIENYRAEKYSFSGVVGGWYNTDTGHLVDYDVATELRAALKRKQFKGVALV